MEDSETNFAYFQLGCACAYMMRVHVTCVCECALVCMQVYEGVCLCVCLCKHTETGGQPWVLFLIHCLLSLSLSPFLPFFFLFLR